MQVLGLVALVREVGIGAYVPNAGADPSQFVAFGVIQGAQAPKAIEKYFQLGLPSMGKAGINSLPPPPCGTVPNRTIAWGRQETGSGERSSARARNGAMY